MENYHPTIWRTCRVLANARRIACLKAVLKCPGRCVGEVAKVARVGESQASLALRALQARGLIVARRESRWVRYFPETDPLVPAAAPIVAGFRQAVLHDGASAKKVLRCLTAFTHPRRLVLLRCLQKQGPLSFEALSKKSRISLPALYRHLKKLESRQLVFQQEEAWALCAEHEPLATAFLNLIAGEQEP